MAYLPLGQIGHGPLGPKNFFFTIGKKGKNWPQWCRIRIFTKLNFLATPPNTDMVDSKPFLPIDAPDPTRWANCILHTVGEMEMRVKMNLPPISISWLRHCGKFELHQKLPFWSEMHQNRWRLGLRLRLRGGAHQVLHTAWEEGDEGKDEFASNLNFLTTPLWWIWIAPKASFLI